MESNSDEEKKANTGSNGIRRYKMNYTDHLLQGIFIFASVFLAFYLSDLRESKNNRAVIENGLENIAAEMVYNHYRLASSFEYFYSLITALDSIQKNHPGEIDDLNIVKLPQWRGLHLPMLRSTAHHTLFNAGVTRDIPIDLTNALAQIYNIQSIVQRFDDAIIASMAHNHQLVSFESIFFFFGSYVELIPEVMAWYQVYGKRHLKKYGYDLNIEDETLRQIVDHYRKFMD